MIPRNTDSTEYLTFYVNRNTIVFVIRTFANKQTAAVFAGYRVRHLPTNIQQRAREKLKAIHASPRIDDLRSPPGNMLERLSGKRRDQWSIRISGQWRICFEWRDGDAYEVEITDYH